MTAQPSRAAAPARAAELVEAAVAGSVRATARLVSIVENGESGTADIGRALLGRPRDAHIIGITGAPGAGKSTLTNALLRTLLSDTGLGDPEGGDPERGGPERGDPELNDTAPQRPPRVAVLAVDPSSPFSGGALLGDRVRMTQWATDPRVFIRSLSSRGNLGGLSAGTPAAIDLMSALGFDTVIVETVGVGQSEVDVMHLADTVAVVLAPGMGDGVQAAKAGIMEIADIIVVNKADHEGARTAVREVKAMLALGSSGDGWHVPVLTTMAESGDGVAALAAAMRDHSDYLRSSGQLADRRARRGEAALRALVDLQVRRILAGTAGRAYVQDAARAVIAGDTDLYRAAAGIVAAIARLAGPPADSAGEAPAGLPAGSETGSAAQARAGSTA